MIKRFAPLYISYDSQRGQVSCFGARPEIVNAFEALGTGMDGTGTWERGGPIVWRPLNERRVVGWMRGLPASAVDRDGAWECWGLLVDDEVDIGAWPWIAQRLSRVQDEVNLNDIGQRLLNKQCDKPSHAVELAGVLTSLYGQYHSGVKPPITIPLNVSMHATALVPWVWLLGPFDPQNAYLGPPRRTPAATSPELAYYATIDAVFPNDRPSSQLSRLDEATASLPSAITLGARLRDPKTWLPSHTVDALSGATPFVKEPIEPAHETEEPPMKQSVGWRTNLTAWFRQSSKWSTTGPWVIVILILVLYIICLLKLMGDDVNDIWTAVYSTKLARPADRRDGRGSHSPTPSTSPAQTATTTTPTPTSPVIPLAPSTEVIREMITRGLKGITYTPALQIIARNGAKKSDEQTKLYVAALQTVFVKRSWSTNTTIDGVAGAGFFAAIKRAGRDSDVMQLLTDDAYLESKLQKP